MKIMRSNKETNSPNSRSTLQCSLLNSYTRNRWRDHHRWHYCDTEMTRTRQCCFRTWQQEPTWAPIVTRRTVITHNSSWGHVGMSVSVCLWLESVARSGHSPGTLPHKVTLQQPRLWRQHRLWQSQHRGCCCMKPATAWPGVATQDDRCP